MNADRPLYEKLEGKLSTFYKNKSFVDLCIQAYPLRNVNHVAYRVVDTMLIDPRKEKDDNVQSNLNDNENSNNCGGNVVMLPQ